ncbi:MAG: hypothetical protein HOM14_09080 [Gammaproteobacteria bacterium]|jgi:hypothetical protein|nr:hypothetical protein [Gammaproteobacteria bacterium]MBT4450926.1 hypothetical protein [Gammaproteobacteria bacterium]MBT4862563.1 hypothetical protein [Gammaproteobacteria bacterium]MBT6551493.1 hypothetical protein [Gammaproteobacteria bacterium]MBT7046719.1 hypothetical protein [Gammaproteobacteria bacterium]
MSFPGNNIHHNLFGLPTSLRDSKTSKYEIISAIKAYLDRSNTQYAVMIDGEWGTGKTYFYKSEIKPLVGDYEAIYISLFGLKTIQDIEDEIFKTISLQQAGSEKTHKGILSLYPEILEDVKIGGSGYAVQFLINQWKENSRRNNTPFVLCLDDLERWEGNFNICLSYINKLVEHENAKCILIGNLKALEQEDQKGFEKAKDKSIGHIYKLENKIDVVFTAALSLINFKNVTSHNFIKTLINENYYQLSNILNQAKYKNIRTIAEAIQLYEYIFNKNPISFTSSKSLAFSYFCSLLATLILFKKYFINHDVREKLLNGYNSTNQGYAFLNELGYFDENEIDYITNESKFLLEVIFSRADKISLTGLFSIVKKGFYCEKDFEGDFQKWGTDSAYEIYLDTPSFYHLEDSLVSKIIDEVIESIFVKKEITNPATLLLLTEHLTSDIQLGVIDLDFDETKLKIVQIFKELYQKGLIDKAIIYDLNFGSNRFIHCQDIYEIVQDLNKHYINDIDNHNLSNFWLEIKSKPGEGMKLLEKFKNEPIFSIYYNPQEVIDALIQFSNSQLFELISWLHARNKSSESRAVVIQEMEQAYNIGEAINYIYQNKFGMQAGHLKKIAKQLMHN